jgi:hypothetical protein
VCIARRFVLVKTSASLTHQATYEVEDLKSFYNFQSLPGQDTLSVIDRLKAHPHLISVLYNSHEIICREFPLSVLKIRYAYDLEINESTLIVEIQRPERMSAEERIDKLEQLESSLSQFSSEWNTRSLLIDYE